MAVPVLLALLALLAIAQCDRCAFGSSVKVCAGTIP
jgi:hypothetical protein